MYKFILSFAFIVFVMGSSYAFAGEDIHYTHGETALKGYLAYPNTDLYPGKRPIILIVHQWKGLGEYEMQRADMLADLGYIAFAIDVYGHNIRPNTNELAAAESSKYKNNPNLARTRLLSALETAKNLENVDTQKIAILGYCFGGTMALELARAGADINAAISFHGGLSAKDLAKKGAVKAAVQIHHGAADPYVSKEEVTAFKQEMKDAHADWHFISYADAVHSFTEKAAGDDPSKGVAYNKEADERSWSYTLSLLEQVL
jgi:dienelactone hydrolase